MVQQLNTNSTQIPHPGQTNPHTGDFDMSNAFLQATDTYAQPVIEASGAWQYEEPYSLDYSHSNDGAVIKSVARNTRSNKKASKRPQIPDPDSPEVTSEVVSMEKLQINEAKPDTELETEAKPPAGLESGLMANDTRSEWYIRHELDGHPYDPRCKTCVMGGLRSKRAINIPTLGEKVGLKYHQHLETAETDTLKFNNTDVDGNKGASGVILHKTKFGEVAMLKNFGALAKAKAWRKMQRL